MGATERQPLSVLCVKTAALSEIKLKKEQLKASNLQLLQEIWSLKFQSGPFDSKEN